jgi:hypothetical protein
MTFVAVVLPVEFFTIIPKVYVIVFPLLLARNVTARVTRSEEQEKDTGKPFRLGETMILQDDAYLSLALRTTLPPASGMLVFAAVNDRTTGTGRLAPSANCGVPTTATVAATIGTVTAIANFERTLKWNMDSLASSIRRGW